MSMLSLAMQLQQQGNKRVRIPALKGSQLNELMLFLKSLK